MKKSWAWPEVTVMLTVLEVVIRPRLSVAISVARKIGLAVRIVSPYNACATEKLH